MSTSSDNPPYLPIGTKISAKFRGAFCESTILRIEKKVRIKFREDPKKRIQSIDNPNIPLSDMVVGKTVTIPVDKKQVQAQITHVVDLSNYFVAFSDGNQTQLRRSQLVQKGERQLSAEGNLNSMPLAEPEALVRRSLRLNRNANGPSTSRRVGKRGNTEAEDRDEPAQNQHAPRPQKRRAAENAMSANGQKKGVINDTQSEESTDNEAGATSEEDRDSDFADGGQQKRRIPSRFITVDDDYVKQTWAILKWAVQKIQQNNYSILSFEELWRDVYTLVFHKKGEEVYNSLKGVIQDRMAVFRNRIVKSMRSGVFLDTVVDSWNEHKKAMGGIKDLFSYLNRIYVSQNTDLLPIYDLGVDVYRSEILKHKRISIRLRDELLESIKNDRKNNQINWNGIKKACDMLISLGNGSRLVYEEEFENPLMKETSDYYRDVCKNWLSDENDACSYLVQVETAMQDEAARASRYLDKTTETKIVQVMEDVMVAENYNTIVYMPNVGVKFMLEHKKLEELTCIFRILKQIAVQTGGLNVLLEALSEYLTETGTNIVKNEDFLKTPVSLVNELLQLKDYFSSLLTTAFTDDSDFEDRFECDFKSLLNSNRQSPELVALYMDDMIQSGSVPGIDEKLGHIMILFRCLQEKDVFEKYFKQYLAKRLLKKSCSDAVDESCSDAVEKALLDELKTECGYQFTRKLESMFKDKELWQTLSTSFRDWQEAQPQKISIDISLRVLTAGVWPTVSCTPIILPPEISLACEMFTKYYAEKHTGRKLTINTFFGNADVKATFYPPSRALGSNEKNVPGPSNAVEKEREPEHKILQVNTHQMIILLQFNHRVRISCQQLMDDLKIPEEELKKNLQSLALEKASQRILVRTNKGKDAIELTDEFAVNDNFQSELTHVKVQVRTGEMETEQEIKETRQRIEEDRMLEVEAAIVRIMKATKRMNQINLAAEVGHQLRDRFTTSPIIIMQRIETLIERKYLQCDENDKRSLQYIA